MRWEAFEDAESLPILDADYKLPLDPLRLILIPEGCSLESNIGLNGTKGTTNGA